MKRIFIVTTLTIVATSALVMAQLSPDKEVLQVNEAINKTTKTQDYISYLNYLSEDALFPNIIDDDVSIVTKNEVVKDVLSGTKLQADPLIKNRRVLSVKAQGNHAIVLESVWRSDGKKINTKFNEMSVYAKQDKKWQMITSCKISE